MNKMTSDILWSIGILLTGVISILLNYKKDPNYIDRYGSTTRGLLIGGFCIIAAAADGGEEGDEIKK